MFSGVGMTDHISVTVSGHKILGPNKTRREPSRKYADRRRSAGLYILDLQPDHLWVMFHARIGVVPPGGVNRATFAAPESEAAAESAASP
jgi:hypothetical protein